MITREKIDEMLQATFGKLPASSYSFDIDRLKELLAQIIEVNYVGGYNEGLKTAMLEAFGHNGDFDLMKKISSLKISNLDKE